PPADALANSVSRQVGALIEIADAEGQRVRYVKPHGALYNRIVVDRAQADAVVAGVMAASLGRPLPLLGPAGSAIEAAAADAGIPFVREAFVDRGYLADATLVPRDREGADGIEVG
ncbi:LamB/YcsF family protein, partial [Rhizobium johnstonii]|uniref:LamB/YcsF family protein n=1 Tax=Rhizobium johnstonii TaxID=3019933 RepID=UPI003F94D1E1